MDEFELFRAQAYSGGVISGALSEASPHHLHENTSSHSGRRRHSSIGLGHDSSGGADSVPRQQHHARDRRHRLLASATGHQHQSLDYAAGYDARDAVVANVTVAIEPPSPTETRRHFNIMASPSAQAAVVAAAGSQADHTDDREDDVADQLRSDVKRRPDKSPLRRRVTSPEAVAASAQRSQEVTSDVGETAPRPIAEERSSDPVENGQNPTKQRSYHPHGNLSAAASSPGAHSRRTSTCLTSGNSLRPASASTSPRRNSCTGLVQTSSSPPLTPPRPSSRRNSAVTYLPDMPQSRSR